MHESQVNELAGKYNCLALHCHHVKDEQHEALQYHTTALNILCNYVSRESMNRPLQPPRTYWDIKNIPIQAHIALTLADIGNVHQKLANYDESAKAYEDAMIIFSNHCKMPETHPRMEAIKRSISQLNKCKSQQIPASKIVHFPRTLTLDELTSSSTILGDYSCIFEKKSQQLKTNNAVSKEERKFEAKVSADGQKEVSPKLRFQGKINVIFKSHKRKDSVGTEYSEWLGTKFSRISSKTSYNSGVSSSSSSSASYPGGNTHYLSWNHERSR